MGKVNIDELARLREERGLTLGQIALRFGVTVGCLAYLCMENGIQRKGATFKPGTRAPGTVILRAGRPVRTFSPAEDEHLLRRSLEGATNAEIGREIGRNQSSVRGRLYTLARHQELGVRP